MYINSNPKTKKEAKQQLADAQAKGAPGLPCHQPGPFGPDLRNGTHVAEGPHYPEPHRWYAACEVHNNHVVRIK